MFCRFFSKRGVRALVIFCALAAAAGQASTALRPIRPFTSATWNELGRSHSRPLLVVFSTTDCTHCPKVIDGLARALHQSRSSVRLVVVVMDGAGQEDLIRQDIHYRRANTLYAFDGDAMALRYTVNPAWRGLTPYVALLPAAGDVRFFAGPPPAEALQALLRQ